MTLMMTQIKLAMAPVKFNVIGDMEDGGDDTDGSAVQPFLNYHVLEKIIQVTLSPFHL